MITEEQRLFINRRRSIQKWRWSFVLLLSIIWGSYIIYMFIKKPLLINPFYVINKIKMDQLDETTLILLGVLSSIAFCLLSVIVIIFIIFMAIAANNEWKLISIIETLNKTDK